LEQHLHYLPNISGIAETGDMELKNNLHNIQDDLKGIKLKIKNIENKIDAKNIIDDKELERLFNKINKEKTNIKKNSDDINISDCWNQRCEL